MGDGRVLVTGATGFVGRALVPALLAAGRRVTVATRRPWPGELPAGARAVDVGPIGPETDWAEALAGAEAVIHLAAHVHVAPERAAREGGLFDAVNHLGAVRLFDEAAARGVAGFVFLSSITVLGSVTPPGGAFDDRTVPAPETPYGRSKLAAERALLAGAAARPGTVLTILRPPLICGAGVGGNLASLARLAALPVPPPLGGIANRRTLLSLDNLVAAIEAVLARPRAGTFVIGDARPVSTSEIARALREGAGRGRTLLPVPARLLGRLADAAGFGGHARRLFGDLAVVSGGVREAFGWSDRVDTLDALRATGAAARGPAGRAGTSAAALW